jgi:hypothetical protein
MNFIQSRLRPARKRVQNSIVTMRQRDRPKDPIITAQRFLVSSEHIPQHIANPSVQRVVRLLVTLTSGTSSYALTINKIALQDASDYTSSANLRYISARVFQLRAYAESPNSLSVSQSPYGLVVIEASSGFSITDRPVTGSSVSSIGLRFPFNVRTAVTSVASTANIAAFSCDQSIAATTNFLVTIDVSVEFFG